MAAFRCGSYSPYDRHSQKNDLSESSMYRPPAHKRSGNEISVDRIPSELATVDDCETLHLQLPVYASSGVQLYGVGLVAEWMDGDAIAYINPATQLDNAKCDRSSLSLLASTQPRVTFNTRPTTATVVASFLGIT